MRGSIWVGDLVRAHVALWPVDETTRQEIMLILGLSPLQQAEDVSAAPRTSVPRAGPSTITGSGPSLPSDTLPPAGTPTTSAGPSPTVIESTLDPVAENDAGPEPLTALPLSPGDLADVPLPFSPLLLPRWTRSILSAALASPDADGPPDLDKLVEMAGRRQSVKSLPRLPKSTLRRGVQVLLDTGPGMELFARDQETLVARIREVVGPTLVQVRRFRGTPARRASFGPQTGRNTYTPPRAGTPVLLLTDLSIGGIPVGETASVSEWLDFATTELPWV
jgi:hypothetical protein